MNGKEIDQEMHKIYRRMRKLIKIDWGIDDK